ncbi:glutaminyl-peptide cyclotransferase-like isoform X1 [Planococcus citri]|uniref:glutaminyl-peptide cyclotransferase-like isoform X1 n=1 Tax=Planococcus citri TaxID=170843 RepID=UPI0031F83851
MRPSEKEVCFKMMLAVLLVFGAVGLVELQSIHRNNVGSRSRFSNVSVIKDDLIDQYINELAQRNDITEFKRILNPILVERVVGTASHEEVKEYIVREMQSLKWNVEQDSFHDATPNQGKLLFTNVIATNNLSASKFLVFACHYDSKLMNFKFIAATDSAVPCAMLIYFAKVFGSLKKSIPSSIGLKFIFFDGEEAFVSWTATDSVYGARHLASQMEARSNLNQIDLMVLLDLLGDSSPQFYSFFSNTHSQYRKLVTIEKRLKSKNLLAAEKPPTRYFTGTKFFGADIKDDHEPFLVKGVPVLHIIPLPFPNVWHTEFDNENIINYDTVKNLLLIFEVFIVQYLTDAESSFPV